MQNPLTSAQNEFLHFRTIFDRNQAIALKQLLENEGVAVELSDSVSGFNRIYLGAGVDRSFAIQIKGEDFNKAEAILKKDSEAALSDVEDDYYLFQFTNEELLDILNKPDEWNSFDVLLSEKLLKERGQDSAVNSEEIEKDRLNILAVPSDASEMIVLGYVFALVTENILGALIGVLLWSLKKTLPDGTTVHRYATADRNQGIVIFIVGTAIFLVKLLIFKTMTGVIGYFSWI